MEHLVAIQPAAGEDHQGQRLAAVGRAGRAIHPAEGFRPGSQAVAAIAHALDQQQVELAALVQAQQFRAEAAGHLQAHAGPGGGEFREDRHQALGGEVLGHPQAQHAAAGLVAQHFGGFFLQGEDAPGVAEQLFAFGGGHHLALAAVQQAAAEAFLQPA
ncbi:hypothetical protein D9M68_690170 [compost metagenome]